MAIRRLLIFGVLVAVVCVATVSVHADPFEAGAVTLRAAHKALLKHFEGFGASARTLDVAQASSVPVPAQCLSPQFTGLTASIRDLCEKATTILESQPEPALLSSSIDFCRDMCFQTIRLSILGTPYEQCAPPGSPLGQYIATLRAGCTESPSGGQCMEYSFKIALRSKTCEKLSNKTSCGAGSNCVWSDIDRKCGLASNEATVAAICTDCLDQLIRASGDADLSRMRSLVCPKVGSTWCAPLFLKEAAGFQATNPASRDGTASDPTKAVNGLCGTTVAQQCTSKMFSALAQTAREDAALFPMNCMKSGSVGSSEAARRADCAWGYVRQRAQADSYAAVAANLCKTKNGAGRFCFLAYTGIGDALRSCLNSCNDTCRTAIGAAVDAAGCCAGSFDEAFMQMTLTAADMPPGFPLPPVPSATATPVPTASPTTTAGAAGGTAGAGDVAADRPNVSPGSVESSIASFCPIPNLRARFSKRCAVKRVKETKKTLRLPLLWSKVNASAVVRAHFEDSLAFDIALNAGIARADVTSALFKEDASQKLKPLLVLPNGRRLQVSQNTAATENGVSATVAIATTSDEDQAAAIKTLDTALASNAATFTATAGTAEGECPECLSSDGVSGLSNAGKLTSTTSTAGTRATVLGAVLVAVFGALAF